MNDFVIFIIAFDNYLPIVLTVVLIIVSIPQIPI